ncbi:MAG: hypothetical protein AAGD14_13295 [Planctomycetota bacterium]
MKREWILCLLCLAPLAGADTTTISTGDGSISLTVPAGWKAERSESKDAPLRIVIRATEPPSWVEVHSTDLAWTAVATARRFADHLNTGDDRFENAVYRADPMPHTRADERDGRLLVSVPLFANGRSYFVQFIGAKEHWDKLALEFWSAGRSLTTKQPIWPPVPDGFASKEQKGFRWAVQPGVKSRDVKRIEKWFDQARKRFEKVYGKIPRPDGTRPLVAVVKSKGDFSRVSKEAASSRGKYTLGWADAALVASIEQSEHEAVDRASFTIQAFQLLYMVRFGRPDPAFIFYGDARLHAQEAALGKRLPTIRDSLFRRLPESYPPLDQVLGLNHGNIRARFDLAALYAAWFRAGPSAARKAYANFLKEFGESGDLAAASRTHLAPLAELAEKTMPRFRDKTLKPTKLR